MFPSSNSGTFALAAPTGYAASFQLPAGVPFESGNALIDLVSVTRPLDLPALNAGLTPLLYFEGTPTLPMILGAGTAFSVTLPSAPPAGATVSVSALDTQFLQWIDYAATCSVAGVTATCTSTNDLVLVNREYALALVTSTGPRPTVVVSSPVSRIGFFVGPASSSTTFAAPGALSTTVTFGPASAGAQIFGDAASNPLLLGIPIIYPTTGTPLFYFVLIPTNDTSIMSAPGINTGTITIVYPPNTLSTSKTYAIGGVDTALPTSNYFGSVLTGRLTTDPVTSNQTLSFDTSASIGGTNPNIPFQYKALFGFVVYAQ